MNILLNELLPFYLSTFPLETAQRTFRKRSRSRGQSLDKNLKLTAEQKCDISTREIEELKELIEIMKDVAEKKLNTFRAVMEEGDIRYSEVKKAQYEFNRDIVNGAVNPRSGMYVLSP